MSDIKFLSRIVSEVCDYAVKNDMKPDDTLKAVAENVTKLLEISTFNRWKHEQDQDRAYEGDSLAWALYFTLRLADAERERKRRKEGDVGCDR